MEENRTPSFGGLISVRFVNRNPTDQFGWVNHSVFFVVTRSLTPQRAGFCLGPLPRGLSSPNATSPNRRHCPLFYIGSWVLRPFKDRDEMSEEARKEKITELTNANQEVLEKRGARRVSVLICRCATYPMYLTLRGMDGSWKEERAIRHVEPTLALQLELSRLSNYNLAPCFVQNQTTPHCHGIARNNQPNNRLFIRAPLE